MIHRDEALREASRYRLTEDLHTHTVFSHGKGRIEDNVRVALSKGLSAIAISDHGPGHLSYGIKREDICHMRAEIDRLAPLYPQIKIYLSVEANIISKRPFLDILPEERALFDFLIGGYHYGLRHAASPLNWLDRKGFSLPPLRRRLCSFNTAMCVRSIYENPLKILTHPGDKAAFDIREIAKACAARGTLMELNRKHPHLSVEEIRIAAKEDVSFIISSDAHLAENVGSFRPALARAIEAGLDLERIVNIEKI